MKTPKDTVLCLKCGKELGTDDAANFNYKEGCFCEGPSIEDDNYMKVRDNELRTETQVATATIMQAMQEVIDAQKDCLRALTEQNSLLKRYCGLDSPKERSQELSNDEVPCCTDIKKDITPSD